jgi:hypothetical protein
MREGFNVEWSKGDNDVRKTATAKRRTTMKSKRTRRGGCEVEVEDQEGLRRGRLEA